MTEANKNKGQPMNYPINRPITNAHRLTAWEARKAMIARACLDGMRLGPRVKPVEVVTDAALLLAFVALMGALLWIM